MFDYVFVTNSPSYYKVRLWNEVAKRKSIFAFFIYNDDETRNADFTSAAPLFPYHIIKGTGIISTIELVILMRHIKFNKLVVTGWESLPMLVSPYLNHKSNNIILCESSVYEYQKSYIKDFIKRCFLQKFSNAFPAGHPHKRLLEALGFDGEINISGGCGLLNYVNQPSFQYKDQVHNFLYVGRLVDVKNIKMLITVFNSLPEKHLTIVGFGPLEGELKRMSGTNITFTGPIPNREVFKYYQQADVFILPSKCEPWGLVVEEALNNGVPVIVSDMVGCREDIVTEERGIVFDYRSEKSLSESIRIMSDLSLYNKMRENISKMDFKQRSHNQISMY